MRPIDPNDQCTVEQINRIQDELIELIDLAKAKENAHQYLEASTLYTQARHLSFHADEGLQVKIINENADNEAWHKLNNKIISLERYI